MKSVCLAIQINRSYCFFYFIVAFIFNWIGFCLSFCITNTIAGRYGAICGFGLSLIKWILIVRFSDYFTGYFNGQYWLWWIFLVLGLLLFFRGFVNYLKVRNMSESMAAAHRTRFFFLYWRLHRTDIPFLCWCETSRWSLTLQVNKTEDY